MNPYEVLGLLPTCAKRQVDAAYRALAKEYHPDVNTAGDADARMKRINEAYELILKGWRPAPPVQAQPMWVVRVYTPSTTSASWWGYVESR